VLLAAAARQLRRGSVATATQSSLLIVPVENQVRELDAKLLLACVAAERGFEVVIGSQFFIFLEMAHLKPGVLIAKSMRSVNDQTLTLTNKFGHDIVAWDEEALVRFDSPEYYPWRYSAKTFATISRLFCWGQDDADFFASYSNYGGAPLHVTGNPRIDLLRHEMRPYFQAKVDALRAAHGDFILINTNFSFVNNFADDLNLVQRGDDDEVIGISRTGRGLSPEFAGAMAAHQQTIFESFCALMPNLSRCFPHLTFVLRPHPSENHDTWRSIVAGLPNLEVIHDGNVVPWLIACRGLLHNGCTTAVEAAVLGTPAITFQPVHSQAFDYHLPNSLSRPASTTDEVMGRIAALAADKHASPCAPDNQHILPRHLAATDGRLATDQIVDVLVNAGYLDGPPEKRSRLSACYGWLGLHARAVIQRQKMRLSNHRANLRSHAHQFPHLSEAEINARIGRFNQQLGRFHGVRARAHKANIFAISRG
jgi:surface carbohydrate biosynthesis protein